MSDDIYTDDIESEEENTLSEDEAPLQMWDDDIVKRSHLHGMYKTWFLDYAS